MGGDVLQHTVNGIVLGSVYGIIALGFALVWKASKVLNFSHGEMLTVGAYLGLSLYSTGDVGFLSGLLILAAGAVLLGIALYNSSVRFSVGSPLFSAIIMTFALGIAIRSIVGLWYGPIMTPYPRLLPSGVVELGAIRFTYVQLIVVTIVGILAIATGLLFRFTRLGLLLRATADNLEGAVSIGVRVQGMFALAWGAAALTAVVGGILVANLQPLLSLHLGALGLRAFPAVVIGGLESTGGALIGGLIIGILEQFASAYVGSDARDAVVFGVLLVFLMIRPYGLFGEKTIQRV